MFVRREFARDFRMVTLSEFATLKEMFDGRKPTIVDLNPTRGEIRKGTKDWIGCTRIENDRRGGGG